MSDLTLLVLSRAIHITAGIVWTGAAFMMAAVIAPMMTRHAAEGFGRWAGVIGQRIGPVFGISSLLTVVSGGYLFAVLHAHDASTGGLVLEVGAAAAVLALLTGALVSRPATLKLSALGSQPDMQEQAAALRRRAALSARVAAALLGVSVLAMALFRYVGGL
jgi:uncharacterized membrane protein